GDLAPLESDLRQLPGELRPPRAAVPACELVDDHPADVVTVGPVLTAGIAEPDHEQVQRRPLTPRPEAHRDERQPSVVPCSPAASASGSAGASAPSASSPSAAASPSTPSSSTSSGRISRVGAVTVATTVSGSSRRVTFSPTWMSWTRSVSPV